MKVISRNSDLGRRGSAWAVSSRSRRGRWKLLSLIMGLMMLLVSVVIVGAWWLWGHQDRDAITEAHPLEWSQACLLATAAFVQVLRSRCAPSTAWRFARLGVALFCASLLLREVDIDAISPHGGWAFVELTIRALAGVAWVVLVWRMAVWWRLLVPHLWTVATSAMVVLVGVGCFFYALSWPFDKFEVDIGPVHARFLEETVQLIATLFLLASALAPTHGHQSRPT